MPKRTDANQAGIVRMLRDFGASVTDLHEVGHGCPDLLCGYHGINFLFEVKTAEGKFTPDEIRFFDEWRGHVYVIHNAEEALQILCDAVEDE